MGSPCTGGQVRGHCADGGFLTTGSPGKPSADLAALFLASHSLCVDFVPISDF